MELAVQINYYIIFCIECFIFWRLNSVLEPKYNKSYLRIAIIILYILMVIKKYIFDLPELKSYLFIGTIVTISYCFITTIILNKNPLLQKVILVFVFSAILAITDLIMLILLKVFINQPLTDALQNINSIYIIFICKLLTVLLFESIIKNRTRKPFIQYSYLSEISIIIFLNLILLLMTIYIFNYKKSMVQDLDFIILFVFVTVLTITIYAILIIIQLEKKSKQQMETKLKLQQFELEMQLKDDIIYMSDKLRKLRHDMNNHFSIIKAFLFSKKYEDLEEYINSIYEDVELANELVLTSNKALSIMINTKKSIAKNKNIEFSSMLLHSDINILDKDMCTLIGNLLDNAIEAAVNSGGKKYIQLMIQRTEEGSIISCENSFSLKPNMSKGKFITRKENAGLHGLGVANITDIVNKYNGEVNFDYDDEVFHVRIIIPS
ncbi:MAG: GHKL domain-containing protein [Mobilitalea sp.]